MGSKPGRPATRGTWHGTGGPNGAGWGGPAKGAGSLAPVGPRTPDEMRDGVVPTRRLYTPEEIAARRAARASAREHMLALYEDVRDDVHEPTPNRIVAADKYLQHTAAEVERAEARVAPHVVIIEG